MRERRNHISSLKANSARYDFTNPSILGFVKSYLAGGTNTFVIGLTSQPQSADTSPWPVLIPRLLKYGLWPLVL